MKSSLLLLLVPCAVLAACNRADTPERSGMQETPMSAPASPGMTPGDTTRDTTLDQNGNATMNPDTGVTGPNTGVPGAGSPGVGNPGAGTDSADTTRTDIQGTNTQRPDGGSADDARRNQ